MGIIATVTIIETIIALGKEYSSSPIEISLLSLSLRLGSLLETR